MAEEHVEQQKTVEEDYKAPQSKISLKERIVKKYKEAVEKHGKKKVIAAIVATILLVLSAPTAAGVYIYKNRPIANPQPTQQVAKRPEPTPTSVPQGYSVYTLEMPYLNNALTWRYPKEAKIEKSEVSGGSVKAVISYEGKFTFDLTLSSIIPSEQEGQEAIEEKAVYTGNTPLFKKLYSIKNPEKTELVYGNLLYNSSACKLEDYKPLCGNLQLVHNDYLISNTCTLSDAKSEEYCKELISSFEFITLKEKKFPTVSKNPTKYPYLFTEGTNLHLMLPGQTESVYIDENEQGFNRELTAISPDQSKVLYIKRTPSDQGTYVFIYDIKTKSKTSFVKHGKRIYQLHWHLNGNVIYSSGEFGNEVYDLDGNLVNDPKNEFAQYVNWYKNNEVVYFDRTSTQNNGRDVQTYRLQVKNINTAKITTLYSTNKYIVYGPISDSAKGLIYFTIGDNELYSVKRSGGVPVKLEESQYPVDVLKRVLPPQYASYYVLLAPVNENVWLFSINNWVYKVDITKPRESLELINSRSVNLIGNYTHNSSYGH